MSTLGTGDRQHLDATGRNIVYCHACSYVWCRAEQGLECPRCRSEITEVVDPSDDPRALSRRVPNPDNLPPSASTSPEHDHAYQEDDSDLEEADTEGHLGVRGFSYRRFGGSRRTTVQRTTLTSRTMGSSTASVAIFTGAPTHSGRPPQDAAPPASKHALQNLERRKVTKELLGEDDKMECVICIDIFQEGQTATFLPCEHWFHDKCLTQWLKKRNTCPLCRASIDKGQRDAGSGRNGDGGGSGGSGNPSRSDGRAGPDSSRDPADRSVPSANPQSSHVDPFSLFQTRHHGPEGRASTSLSEVPSQSQTPLNQVMRGISSSQREQQHTRGREAAAEQTYDTSSFQQRRTSLSPTAPGTYTAADLHARMRQRSPVRRKRRRTPPEGETNDISSSQREQKRTRRR